MSNYKAMVTKDEFKELKDRLFRGESIEEIHDETGRSSMTIRRIEKSSDYESYLALVREENTRYGKNAALRKQGLLPAKQVSMPSESFPKMTSNRWVNIQQFREHLDTVLIDFITQELEQQHEEVMRKISLLEKENQFLKKQIEALSGNSFVKSLKERITPGKVEEEQGRTENKI